MRSGSTRANPGDAAYRLGLALSGGGSRAAAFHRGTLKALDYLGLLSEVQVVSTVSGGSVFAAAWAAAIAAGQSTAQFLDRMRRQLRKGFVLRALLKPPWLFALLPTYPRTKLLARVFESFTGGMPLAKLPPHPVFVFNTTVLNSGAVGKFTREGLSAAGLGPREADGSNPTAPCTTFPVSLAAAASAAFPVGLPPLLIDRDEWFPHVNLGGPLKGHTTLALTDGGVLENLGAQTLLKSSRFSADDLVVSDAGTNDKPWRPRSPLAWLRSFGIWLASGSILERFVLTMNDKENRWMREVLFDRATGHQNVGAPRRNVLLVRVAASWKGALGNVSAPRLRELFGDEAPEQASAERLMAAMRASYPERAFLLERALATHDLMGMTTKQIDQIGTHFFGMSGRELDALSEHAYWQVLVAFALYWEPFPTERVAALMPAAPA